MHDHIEYGRKHYGPGNGRREAEIPSRRTYEPHLRLTCEDLWLKSVSGKTDEYERTGYWKSDLACHKLRILKDKIVALVGKTEIEEGG